MNILITDLMNRSQTRRFVRGQSRAFTEMKRQPRRRQCRAVPRGKFMARSNSHDDDRLELREKRCQDKYRWTFVPPRKELPARQRER